MELSFLLLLLPLCLAHCPENHYKDENFKKCRECTPCHITLTPCTKNKDAVCASFNDNTENHHFKKNRLHFFDDTLDGDYEEELHAKNFLPHQKDHQKKTMKHSKPKHEDKHHNKKKHFEFEDENYDGDYDDNTYYNDELDFNFEKIDKPKKHKKHFEFTKKHNKKFDDVLSPEELEDEKLHFILGKDLKKNKKKPNHSKKLDVSEEELEQLLIQSEMKLELRKDNLLKTLKDENGPKKSNSKKKIRLNSPVSYSDSDEVYDNSDDYENSKAKDKSMSDALKEFSDDYKDADSSSADNAESYKPVPPLQKSHKAPSHVIGQGKDVDNMIRLEMGKNDLYEKPSFNVIPFVVGKGFIPEKKVFPRKYHSSLPEKRLDSDYTEEYRELKTNEVVSLPFSAAETLVWDWQAVAVASAVASCLVFFLVVALYFLFNTRHWKKVNKHYNKEFEEMSTRIALMQPTLDTDGHSTTMYMENIISPMKEENKKSDVKV